MILSGGGRSPGNEQSVNLMKRIKWKANRVSHSRLQLSDSRAALFLRAFCRGSGLCGRSEGGKLKEKKEKLPGKCAKG